MENKRKHGKSARYKEQKLKQQMLKRLKLAGAPQRFERLKNPGNLAQLDITYLKLALKHHTNTDDKVASLVTNALCQYYLEIRGKPLVTTLSDVHKSLRDGDFIGTIFPGKVPTSPSDGYLALVSLMAKAGLPTQFPTTRPTKTSLDIAVARS